MVDLSGRCIKFSFMNRHYKCNIRIELIGYTLRIFQNGEEIEKFESVKYFYRGRQESLVILFENGQLIHYDLKLLKIRWGYDVSEGAFHVFKHSVAIIGDKVTSSGYTASTGFFLANFNITHPDVHYPDATFYSVSDEERYVLVMRTGTATLLKAYDPPQFGNYHKYEICDLDVKRVVGWYRDTLIFIDKDGYLCSFDPYGCIRSEITYIGSHKGKILDIGTGAVSVTFNNGNEVTFEL